MSTRVKIVPVRILKIWFDICLVLAGAATLMFLLWLPISPMIMVGREMPADATVQVVIGERSWLPVYELEHQVIKGFEALGIDELRLVKARAELRFVTTSWWLHFASLGGILLGSVIILYVIWILRRVLINVLADRPFDETNGRLLQRSGLIVLILGVIWPAFGYVLSDFVLSGLEVIDLDLRPAITFSSDVLIVGLLFLVFGAILTRGHEIEVHERELEEEQRLTV